MKHLVQCGVLKGAYGMSPILCDVATGEAIWSDDICGNCVLSNITVMEPVTRNEKVYLNFIDYFNCKGVVVTEDYIIIFREDVAEYHKYTDIDKIEHVTEYDTDIVYNEEFEEWGN